MKDDGCRVDFGKFEKETGLDVETVKDLYRGFLEEILEDRDKLSHEFQSQEYGKLARTVHNIKGVSSSYMAEDLFHQALKLDSKLKKNDTAQLESMIHILEEEIMKTANEIYNYLSL